MKTKKCSKPDFKAHGDFTVLWFVPGDHVKIEFDAWSFMEVVVMVYKEKDFSGEKPSGKEDDLLF